MCNVSIVYVFLCIMYCICGPCLCIWYSLKRELALINKELQSLNGADCESQRRDPVTNWTKVFGVVFLCTLLQFCFVQFFCLYFSM